MISSVTSRIPNRMGLWALGGATALFLTTLYKYLNRSYSNNTSLDSRVNVPQEGEEYSVVNDLFSPEMSSSLKSFFSQYQTPFGETKFIGNSRRQEFYAKGYQKIVFSENYCPLNAELLVHENIPEPIGEALRCLIARFGKELKLVGPHFLAINVLRYVPKENVALGQGWHYDHAAKQTMVAVVQNDLEPIPPNLGLDLSFNSVSKTFNPLIRSKAEDAEPLENYRSIEYPENGGIIFEGQRGHIIHKMSTLAAKTFNVPSSPPTRTIFAILRQDSNWISEERLKEQQESVV